MCGVFTSVMCTGSWNMFEANAEVIRNSLPLSLCGRRDRGGWRWAGGVESHWSRRCSATLSYWLWGREVCRGKGQRMGLHKACGLHCILSNSGCDCLWMHLEFKTSPPLFVEHSVREWTDWRGGAREAAQPWEMHNSRTLLNKKSVTINSKPSLWLEHCFRFRRPGFPSITVLVVITLKNQPTILIISCFYSIFLIACPRSPLFWTWPVYIIYFLCTCIHLF